MKIEVKNEILQAIKSSPDLDECEWPRLTKLIEKQALFGVDPFFRSSYLQFRFQNGGSFPYVALNRTALLIIQPDGVAAGIAGAVQQFLLSHGFHVRGAITFRHDYHSVREEWRYQFNEMTLPRMHLTSMKYTMADSIVLVLRDTRAKEGMPASVRLQKLKGSSSPSGRSADQLRTIIGSPNGLLKFLHSPDEPADIIRELATSLARPVRRKVIDLILNSTALGPTSSDEFAAVLGDAYAHRVVHDMDPSSSRKRLTSRLRELRSLANAEGDVSYCLTQLANGEGPIGNFDWLGFADRWHSLRQVVDWDLIVSASDLVVAKYPNSRSLIDSDGSEHWAG